MAGKRHGEHAWRFLTAKVLYRTLTGPDLPEGSSSSSSVPGPEAELQAYLDALPEYIDLAYPQGERHIEIAYDNYLSLGVLTTVDNYRISVYADMSITGVTTNRWCLVASEVASGSRVLVLRDVPPTSIKVLLTDFETGTANIVEQHSV